MTQTEAILVSVLLLLLAATVAAVLQVRAIAREVRSEGRETRDRLAASVSTVIEMERAELQALRESMEGRPMAAVRTLAEAEAIPKPHRHQWAFNSEEQTNGESVRFHVCRVTGCRDVYREGPSDDPPRGEVNDAGLGA